MYKIHDTTHYKNWTVEIFVEIMLQMQFGYGSNHLKRPTHLSCALLAALVVRVDCPGSGSRLLAPRLLGIHCGRQQDSSFRLGGTGHDMVSAPCSGAVRP